MLDCVKKGLIDLFRNKLRTFLTIGGISIGVLSVVVISSIGQIGKYAINKQLNSMGMDSIVVSSDKSNQTGLNERDLKSLKNINSVQNAMPLMNKFTRITVLDNSEDCMVWGVNEDANNVIELEAIYGRLINRGDVVSAANVCIIDEQVALNNYKRSNIVGKTITVDMDGKMVDLTVIGIVKNGVNVLQSSLGEIIPNFVYIPYTTMQSNCSQLYFDQIAVKVKKNTNLDNINNDIERTLKVNRSLNSEVSIENLLKQRNQLDNIMNIITIILSIIAGISLIVSGLSIMTVMLVQVNERTREIGIKKSIGANNCNILGEFMLESVLITFIGGLIGVILGLSIAFIGCIIFGLAFKIQFSLVVGILAFSMAIGLLFGVYPAYRAATLKPVDALRFE